MRGSQSAQRWKLVFLAALFFVPLGISFLWYYGLTSMHPDAGVQHGELIEPARPLPRLALPLAQGGTTAPAFLERTWTLVYIAEGPCDAACRERLQELRQLRLALGRERNRVSGVLLYSGTAPETTWLESEHTGLIAASVDGEEAREALLSAFPGDDVDALFTAGRVYIVDPNGNLMMTYAAGMPLRDIHDDLKRLLRLSRIG
jgi:cytochrome oxidase Cu insertion factor (SCO1/SenC/PrrC family)